MDGSWYTFLWGRVSGVSSVFNPYNHPLRGRINISIIKSRLGELNHMG